MGRQLYREPRITLLGRPDSERRANEQSEQLESLLSELLNIRSMQASLLEQPSQLKAACSLLPPCSTVIVPPRFSCVAGRNPIDSLNLERRPLTGYTRTESNVQELSTLVATLSGW